MQQLIFVFVIFLVCASGLMLYHYKWQALEKRLNIDKILDDVEALELLEKDCKKQLPLHIKLFLPGIFFILFLLELMIISYLFQQAEKQMPLMLIFMAICFPILLVFFVYSGEVKNIRPKFWFSFLTAIIIESFFAFEIFLLLNNYYFENVIRFKHIGRPIVTSIIFFSTAYLAQRNWLNWRCYLEDSTNETKKL